MKAIIDVGTILYRAALSAQTSHVVVTHKASGRQKEFEKVTDFWGHHSKKAGGWLQATNDARIEKGLSEFTPDEFSIETRIELVSDGDVSPEAIACGRLKNKIESIANEEWCSDFIICHGVGENFRYAKAQTQPYKHGRAPRPLMFDKVVEYMYKKWPDKIIRVDGVEDDDIVTQLTFEAWKRAKGDFDKLDSVSVFIEKDLTQTPCIWYNFDKPELGLKRITETESHYNFAKQLLCGDGVDSIPSLPALDESLAKKWGIRKTKGVGKKTAEAILDGQTTQGMYERVSEAYKAFYGIEKQPFTSFRGDVFERNWLDHMNERFQLLRLRRDVTKPVGHVKDFLLEQGVVL